MILSRTMREADYAELESEGLFLKSVHDAIQMWYPPQHKHRLWEYTIALKALNTAFDSGKRLRVSDIGCAGSFLSPMLYWLGHDVFMYEVWQFGDLKAYTMEQMVKTDALRTKTGSSYQLREYGLCSLREEDRNIDAAFCISTIEHISNYQDALRDMCRSVKPGGLMFLTSDFCEHELDDYHYNYLRAGKMFTKDTYQEMQSIGESEGFKLVGGESDWSWEENRRLVHNYGFACLAMVKEN